MTFVFQDHCVFIINTYLRICTTVISAKINLQNLILNKQSDCKIILVSKYTINKSMLFTNGKQPSVNLSINISVTDGFTLLDLRIR